MSEYPEHDKLSKVQRESQAIGEFLDWLAAQGIQRMRWERVTNWRTCDSESRGAVVRYRCTATGRGSIRTVDHTACELCNGTERYEVSWEDWAPDRRSIEQVLAAYFNIDLSK